MNVHDIPTPCLVVDCNRLQRNLDSMASRCRGSNVSFRPHIKTHKSPELARLQLRGGACGITVATIEEARAFADAGFDDITWAFPIIPSRIEAAAQLADRIKLQIVVDSLSALHYLRESGSAFNVLIKIDCGYHRAGVAPEGGEVEALATAVEDAPNLRLAGLITHAGHAYDCRSGEGIATIAEQERMSLVTSASHLSLEHPVLSLGSTPTLIYAETFEGVTEARAGNYVFFDLMQTHIGSCNLTDCALSVVSTVVSSSGEQNTSIMDAGALSMSKDQGPEGHYGRYWTDYESGVLSSSRLTGLSQEHGKLDVALPVGDRIRILPNHACLTAAQFDNLHVADDDNVVDSWPIMRVH